MDSFKIKVPDSILSEHLDGLSPKSRNFEFVRLAMNGLLMEKGVFNFSALNSNVNSEPVANIKAHSGVTNESKGDKSIHPTQGTVDFGMDITNM